MLASTVAAVKRFVAACVVIGPFLLAGCGGGSSASVSLPASSISPKGQTISDVVVERVVDGDTFKIRQDGKELSVRMIGLDTPETVKPNTPVACYGPEASDFTKAALSGKKVTLEFDESQGATDKYGRMLAYVWVPSGSQMTFFNEALIAGGYAEEVQYAAPYRWQSEMSAAEQRAQSARVGLWGACR